MDDCTVSAGHTEANAADQGRVRPSDIERYLESVHFFTAADGALHALAGRFPDPAVAATLVPSTLQRVICCVLVLGGGETVTGVSACARAEDFDAEAFRKLARQDAIQKACALLERRLQDGRARAG